MMRLLREKVAGEAMEGPDLETPARGVAIMRDETGTRHQKVIRFGERWI
jgi:hypothetical protein